MNRRISIAMACVMLVMTLATGCSMKQSPGDQVKLILEEIKTNQIETNVKKLFNTDELGDAYADEYEELIAKIQDFDYKIVDEYINEDKTEATVTVAITTYDYVSAYEAAREDVVSKAEKGKLDRDSDVADFVTKSMLNNMLKLDDKSVTTEVTLNCTLNESGDWAPDVEKSKDLVNAILGGLVTEEKLKVKIKK